MNAPTHTANPQCVVRFNYSLANSPLRAQQRVRRLLAGIGFLLVLTFGFVNAQAVTRTSTASGGNWNVGSSWVGGVAPAAGDDAVIVPGATMTVTANATINSITFSATSSSTRTLTVNTGVTLTVTTGITLQNAAGSDVSASIAGQGTISCASLTVGGTNTSPSADQSTQLTSTITTLTMSGDLSVNGEDNSSSENNASFFIPSGTVTVQGNITVDSDLIAGGTGATATLTLVTGAQTGTLSVGGAISLTGTGTSTVTFNGTNSTVIYSGASQTIFSTTYTNLTLSGSGTKTPAGSFTTNTTLTINAGVTLNVAGFTLSLSSATITINGTLDFTDTAGSVTNSSSNSMLTMGANGLIKTLDQNGLGPAGGASLINAGSTFTTTSIDTNGTVEYNRSADATGIITDRNYNNLTITNSQAKTWTRTVTNRTINGSVTINTNASFTLNGAFAVNVWGNWSNDGTFTTSTGTVAFNGASPQTIDGANSSSFAALFISNIAGVTMNTSGSASGLLTLTTDLTVTDPAMLTQSGTSSGTGDVVGMVRRTDVGGTTRAFGNPNVQLTNSGGTATQVDLFLVKGTAPSGFGQAVLRTYTLTPGAGSTPNATVRLRYLDPSELNGNTEANLTLWRNDAGTWTNQGGTVTAAGNYVELTGVTSFSSWAIAAAPSAPTAVKLARFNAFGYADGVGIAWQSGDEVNNLGYHIYRDVNGRRIRVTPSLVAGSALRVGPGMRMAAGFSYNWFDPSGNANTGYYLEAVDLNGTREIFGPIYPLAGKSISPRGQRARLVNELNQAGRADGGQRFDSGWAASTVKDDRNELSKLSSASLSGQHKIAAGPAVKIPIQRNGWYRLNHGQLAAAGLDVSRDARFLQMFVDGEEIPIRLSGNGINFTPSDTIEFYGLGLDTPSTDKRVYWLVSGSQHGRRISAKRPKGRNDIEWSQSGIPSGYLFTSEVKERISYFPNLLNGDAENIFGPLVTDVPETQTIQVNNPDRQAGSAQLSIALQGASTHEHAVQIQLNNVVLDTVVFNGMQNVVRHLNVDRSLLLEGANTLKFTAVNGELDIVFVDWARLTYLRQYKAKNNELQFSLNPGRAVRVSGFTTSDIRVMDITNPDSVAEVPAQIMPLANGYGAVVQAQGAGQRTLIAVGNDAINPVQSVSANQPSSWHNGANAADMVIITHRDFRNAVELLAALRRNQGLAVVVVDVEDVFDEFGYGAHSPTAVKAFLSWAASSWSRAPRYLLLAGDSSWDPRNYTQEGENDFVPTKMIDTRSMETASDDWLADFNGDDIADMAVGRLPGRTAAEIGLMVSKIQRYELDIDQGAAPRGALLVADDGFESQSSQTGSLLPPSMAVQSINRSQVGNDDVARSQIMTALNNGPLVVNYYGHGSVNVWTGAGLLDNDLAATLTNGNRLSLFVMMTCLNGYAHDAYTETLGEAVLKAQNGGAVAVWASSGFTESQPQFVLDTEFYRQLFGPEPVRLGEAARNAKAVVSDPDVRRTWILLGDPAMRIR